MEATGTADQNVGGSRVVFTIERIAEEYFGREASDAGYRGAGHYLAIREGVVFQGRAWVGNCHNPFESVPFCGRVLRAGEVTSRDHALRVLASVSTVRLLHHEDGIPRRELHPRLWPKWSGEQGLNLHALAVISFDSPKTAISTGRDPARLLSPPPELAAPQTLLSFRATIFEVEFHGRSR